MRTTKCKWLSILLIAALALSLLAGCSSGGGGGASEAGAPPTSTETPEKEPPAPSEDKLITYEIYGYYSVDVPSDLKVQETEDGRTLVDSDDNGNGKWRMELSCIAPERMESSVMSGFSTMKLYYINEEAEGLASVMVGEQEGFYYIFRTGDRSHVNIQFPFGSDTGDNRPYGFIAISERGGNDGTKYLGDPVVQAILSSVRLLVSEPEGGTLTYNVIGDSAIFAVDVPLGLNVNEFEPSSSIEISAEDSSWKMILQKKDKSMAGRIQSAKDEIGSWTEHGIVTECGIGTAQGYTGMKYNESDGGIRYIVYTFPSLTGDADTWGLIVISCKDPNNDAASLSDDPTINAILDSVRAPE